MICTRSERLLMFAATNSASTFTVSSRALVSGFGLVSFFASTLAAALALALLAFSSGGSGLRPRALRPDTSVRSGADLSSPLHAPSHSGSLLAFCQLDSAPASSLLAFCQLDSASSRALATVWWLRPISLAIELSVRPGSRSKMCFASSFFCASVKWRRDRLRLCTRPNGSWRNITLEPRLDTLLSTRLRRDRPRIERHPTMDAAQLVEIPSGSTDRVDGCCHDCAHLQNHCSSPGVSTIPPLGSWEYQ